MSVATELTKLNTNILNAYDEVEIKNGIIPQNKNTDNLATAIRSIPAGGGGADEYFATTNDYRDVKSLIKKVPDLTLTNSNLSSYFSGCGKIEEIGNITATNCTNASYLFFNCSTLANVGTITLGNTTNFTCMFQYCSYLVSAPELDTSLGTGFTNMFYGCGRLQNVPIYDFSSATTITNLFGDLSTYLTDTSLDNILQTLTSATSFTGTKTLASIGFDNWKYRASRIQALPHYQDFLDAGWTIGY